MADDGGVWVKVYPDPDGGGLEGLGDWAEVTDASVAAIQYGDYDRYVFDTAGSHYITFTEGVAAVMLVGGGGGGRFEPAPASVIGGNGGAVQYGLHFFSDGRKDITVGAAGTYPLGAGGTSEMTGVVTPSVGGGSPAGNSAGTGAGGPARTPNGGIGATIDGVEYGRGGYVNSGTTGNATEKPSSAGTYGWGGSGTQPGSGMGSPEQPATGGLVMVDVLRKTATKANAVPPFGWPIEEIA